MEERALRDLETLFSKVEDSRVERTKLHRLRDIITQNWPVVLLLPSP